MSKIPFSSVAIIGGGCAGLAAAATLAEHNIAVHLFEAAPQLGGRARGVNYKDVELDNGQHILLGAYSETLRLLNLAGVDFDTVLARLPLTMHMQHLQTGQSLKFITCKHLPAPFHLLAGLITAKGLTLKDKYLAITMMIWLNLHRFTLKKNISLKAFLGDHQQSTRLIEYFWEPLCLAALNTPLEAASAQVFLNVLRDSFARKKSDSDMLLAKVDLSSLIAQPLRHYIESHGGIIQTGSVIKSISSSANGYSLQTNTGEALFDYLIIAVAPHQLDKVVPNIPEISQLAAHLTYQPITTVYLQYEASTRLPHPMQGMISSLCQWVFDRGQLCGQAGLIAVVISAEGPHIKMTNEALAEKVMTELAMAFPQLKSALWHKVITEKRATFSCNAGLQRPRNITNLKNLYLAGDYTEGDYPATIEGAIRSGVQSATHIIHALKASK